MNFLKHIQILVFVLFPACLMGMESGSWTEHDKFGNPIILECHKVTDYKILFNWEKKLMPIIMQAFADEPMDLVNFLLDKQGKVKQEHTEMVEGLTGEEREKLDWKIAISKTDKKSRMKSIELWFVQKFKRAEKQLVTTQQNPINFVVVVAKSDPFNIWGFAIFQICRSDVTLSLLAVLPSAQGKGLARPLVFSLTSKHFADLKLIPETRRIHLGTEIWNIKAQAIYKKLGFMAQDQDETSILFEYTVKS